MYQSIPMLRETDLAFKLQSLLKNKTSVLDVGCEYGKDLFPFLDLGFTDLHGIDDSNKSAKFLSFHYVRYKLNYVETALPESIGNNEEVVNMKMSMEPLMVQYYWPSLYTEFQAFKFEVADALNYKFDKTYDLIIIKNVIHFFHQKKRIELLSKLVNCLNEDGILYVYANSVDRTKRYGNQTESFDWSSLGYCLLNGDDFLEIESLFGKLNLNFKVNDREDRRGEEIIIRKTKSIET